LVIIFGFLCVTLGYVQNTTKNQEQAGEDYFIKQGYSFAIPEGWVYDSSMGIEAIVKEDSQDFSPYIVFLTDNLNGRSDSQFFDYVKAEIANSVSDYELLEEQDDGDVHIIKIQGVAGEEVIVFKIAFVKGLDDNYWFITLNDNVDAFADNESSFDEVYKSFELR
jgi:hypothetical protein